MIKSLTSLRGIFILFIFFHHCLHIYPGGGTMAVSFFFVLGGFSMTLGYRDRVMSSRFDYKQYILRRGIKFYPLHWLTLMAALPFALLAFNKWTVPEFVVNAALLQTWIPIKSVYFSFNGVSWYLANTMFFAIVFPFVLRFIMRCSKVGRAAMITAIVITYTLLVVLLPQEWYHAILYISPYVRLTDFVLGIFLGLAYLTLKEQKPEMQINNILWHFLVIALIGLLVAESCFLPETARLISPVYWLLVAALILITSIPNGGDNLLENKYLHRLGELSFVIFMTHQLVIRYTSVAFGLFNFKNDVIFVCTTLLLTIAVSALTDKYILKPVTQWLTKRIQPSMTARS